MKRALILFALISISTIQGMHLQELSPEQRAIVEKNAQVDDDCTCYANEDGESSCLCIRQYYIEQDLFAVEGNDPQDH